MVSERKQLAQLIAGMSYTTLRRDVAEGLSDMADDSERRLDISSPDQWAALLYDWATGVLDDDDEDRHHGE